MNLCQLNKIYFLMKLCFFCSYTVTCFNKFFLDSNFIRMSFKNIFPVNKMKLFLRWAKNKNKIHLKKPNLVLCDVFETNC